MQSLKKFNSHIFFISDLLEKMAQQNVYVNQHKVAFGIQQMGPKTNKQTHTKKKQKNKTAGHFFMRMNGYLRTIDKVCT